MFRQAVIGKNKVTFTVISEFSKEREIMTLENRYAMLLRTRWSLLHDYMEQYFIEHGQRGCYIGERKDRYGYYYDIWDLSKIFPDVSFKENNYSNLC